MDLLGPGDPAGTGHRFGQTRRNIRQIAARLHPGAVLVARVTGLRRHSGREGWRA